MVGLLIIKMLWRENGIQTFDYEFSLPQTSVLYSVPCLFNSLPLLISLGDC